MARRRIISERMWLDLYLGIIDIRCIRIVDKSASDNTSCYYIVQRIGCCLKLMFFFLFLFSVRVFPSFTFVVYFADQQPPCNNALRDAPTVIISKFVIDTVHPSPLLPTSDSKYLLTNSYHYFTHIFIFCFLLIACSCHCILFSVLSLKLLTLSLCIRVWHIVSRSPADINPHEIHNRTSNNVRLEETHC